MSIIGRFRSLNTSAGHFADYLRSPLLLAIRLYWGWQFFETGKGKLGNLEGTTKFFESLGLPAPGVNAAMAGTTECVGGLLLLVGLGSRLITVPLAFTMIVAYGTAHVESVRNILEKPDDFVTQAPFLFLLASLVVLAFGPGAFSVDALLGRLTEADSGKAESRR